MHQSEYCHSFTHWVGVIYSDCNKLQLQQHCIVEVLHLLQISSQHNFLHHTDWVLSTTLQMDPRQLGLVVTLQCSQGTLITVTKFVDNTTIIGWITNTDVWQNGAQRATKTKEMIVDFRKRRQRYESLPTSLKLWWRGWTLLDSWDSHRTWQRKQINKCPS